MKKPPTNALLAITLGLSACTSPSERVLKEYLNQDQCEGRLQFILEPEKYREPLLSRYADLSTCKTEHGKIDIARCAEVPVGGRCLATAEKMSTRYCLYRESDAAFKIDWPCSTGWNPLSLTALKAEKLSQPTAFRVEVELGVESGLAVVKSAQSKTWADNNFAVSLLDKTGGALAASMPKHRDGAKELYDLLRDGKKHRITLTLAYGVDREYPQVVSFLRPDWLSLMPDEEAKVAALAETFPVDRAAIRALEPCCKVLAQESERSLGAFMGAIAGAKGNDAKLDQVASTYDNTVTVAYETCAKEMKKLATTEPAQPNDLAKFARGLATIRRGKPLPAECTALSTQ